MASNEKVFSIDSFTGLVRKTNRFQSRDGDLWGLENGRTDEIGSINKSMGYAQRESTLTSTTSTSSSTSTTTTSTSTSTTTSTSTSTSTS